ncbi:MAG TPA: DUF1570 domain-containing protein [Fimbriiglobus sp.]|nr:DUF1570 domain-containing protein [Fimbriiglobus sp.]
MGAESAWVYDEVTLTNGYRMQGMILKESPAGIEFQVIRRPPGRPTVTLTTFIAAREMSKVRRLAAADRAALKAKLAGLDLTGAGARKRMEALALTPTDWLGRPGAAQRYESEQFVLVSGAADEVTRRAAVRLEQIYAAFARVLPPRRPAGRPTTVLLAGRPADYEALVCGPAGRVLNPAVYDPRRNRIVCGTDLARLGAELTATQKKHAAEWARLDRYEADIRQLYKGRAADLERFEEIVRRERRRVYLADHANGRKFDEATRRLFALLYHEAFHAYTATFVYPPLSAADVRAGQGTGELPRWLNEGLAQLFEGAVVEGTELRVGPPDAKRLEAAQDLLRGMGSPAGLVPLADLLRAGKDSFLTVHADQRSVADRAYLTSWALTYWLTFDKQAVGTGAFEEYLAAVNSGGDPVAAFEKWIGTDARSAEKEWHDYLRRLRVDGSVAPPVGPKGR